MNKTFEDLIFVIYISILIILIDHNHTIYSAAVAIVDNRPA